MQVKKVTDLESFNEDAMVKVNVFETPRFFCDIYCLRPGQSQKVHSHAANDKLYYIVRGEATVIVGSESRALRAGEIVLAPAGEPHGVTNESGADAVCLVFMAPHPRP
jgi:mannose-6-phosphate isomerase-like protein (cupin superfamily)